MDDDLVVVFDTVVFVRALINPHSNWGQLIFEYHQDYRLIVTPQIVREYVEVLQRPELISRFSPPVLHLLVLHLTAIGRPARPPYEFAPARSAQTPTRAVDVKAGRRSDLAKYTDIARPCLNIHEHGGRLDAVGRQRAISGSASRSTPSVAP